MSPCWGFRSLGCSFSINMSHLWCFRGIASPLLSLKRIGRSCGRFHMVLRWSAGIEPIAVLYTCRPAGALGHLDAYVLYTCRTSGALGGLPRTLLSLKRIGVSCGRFHIAHLWSEPNHQSFSIDISLRWSESTRHSVDRSHHWCLGNNLNRFIKLTPLVINVRRRGYALFLRRRLWRDRARERVLRRREAKAGNS